MAELRILWIDDDIDAVRSVWEPDLKERVSPDLKLGVERLKQGLGVLERLAEAHFDLLVLDVELHDEHVPTSWHLLERMRKEKLAHPVVLFSNYVATPGSLEPGRYETEIRSHRKDVAAAFAKSPAGIEGLARYLTEFAKTPPVTMVVVSDLHFGLQVKNRDSYLESFSQSLAEVKARWRPDHLVLLGDFAWQGRADDLDFALRFVARACRELDLHQPGAVQFCPGNHDIQLGSDRPWTAFQEFVEKLADRDPAVATRYSDPFRHGIRKFSEPEDVVAVGSGARSNVLFASLNSVDPAGHAQRITLLGRKQLDRLEHLLREMPEASGALRIALLHHPLFPVPADDEYDEDRILVDSARVFRDLSRLGFQLLLNGHSHYSCLHEHRVVALNHGPESKPSAQRLAVVSMATLGGQPSSATPFRQYGILRIGHREPNGNRTVALHTRIYSVEKRTFDDGNSIEFTIESRPPGP